MRWPCRSAIAAAVLVMFGVPVVPCRAEPPRLLRASRLPYGDVGVVVYPPRVTPFVPVQLAPPRPVEPGEGVGGVAPLKEPPLEPTDVALPINLAAALRLADARPIVVAAAQASLWVAEAQLLRAKVLWLPTFNMGFDYVRHDGYGPDFNRGLNIPPSPTDPLGRPQNQNVNFLLTGGGFTMFTNMCDAIYQPLVQKQVVRSRQADIQTAKNDAVFDAASAYFAVHMSRGQYAGARDVVDRAKRLVGQLDVMSKDLIPKVEVDRARNALAEFEEQAAAAREDWRVQSANLTLVLRLDPRAVIVPLERDHLQVTIIDPNRSLDDLIPVALTNRPELASQQALVQASLARIRQERMRPRLPVMALNGFQTPHESIQFGAVGVGRGSVMDQWSSRSDFSVQMLWQFEGLGIGNHGRVQEQRGEQSRAVVELFRTQDRVSADVTRAQARIQSAAVRVTQAERSLREALTTFDGNYEGLKQTTRFGNVLTQVYRPQEVVVALQSLKVSYDKYFATVAEYNRAQFEMFRALGYPASEVANAKELGDPGPVDTSRPGYLPQVQDGAPVAPKKVSFSEARQGR